MRILHVVTLASPDGAFGGPLRVAVNQAEALRTAGQEVLVIAGARGFDVEPTMLGGASAKLFPAVSILPGSRFAGMFSSKLIRWLVKHAEEFDVAHIHYARDLIVMPAARILRKRGVPCVLQPHGMIAPSNHPLAGTTDRLFIRSELSNSAAVLALNLDEERLLREVARGPINVQLLPNGVPEPKDYHPALDGSRAPEFVFIGRLHPVKRPDMLVRAAQLVARRGISLRAAVVGPDEGAVAAIDDAIESLRGVVVREAALAPADVASRIAASDVVVLPSERESFGMSAAEAMALGRPVIVAENHGIAPYVKKGGGLVFDGSEEGLADAIAVLARDKFRRNEMGRRAAEIARADFSMGVIGRKLIDIYENAYA